MSPLARGAAPAPVPSCSAALAAARPIFDQRLAIVGTLPTEASIPGTAARDWLLEVREQGNDAIVEVLDSADRLIARSDHPERRTGTHRAMVTASTSAALRLKIAGKEHDGLNGTADVRVIDFAALAEYPACARAYRMLAAADSDYANGQQISLGTLKGPAGSARHAYLRAAEEYLSAYGALDDGADRQLRGEVALALAGVEYFDLQQWDRGAQWAAVAQPRLLPADPYRAARAQALAAAAWIETAAATDVNPGKPGAVAAGQQLFARTRQALRELVTFHERRGERYDTALQVNNIGLAYFYESRYADCAREFLSASRLFAAVSEVPRQALAWQNRAMCFWGLGHLPEALPAFNEALAHLGPKPYPQLYLLTLNNTALVNYALGHFDEALRLHDRALSFAIQLQNRREQAAGLYGIGVTYYALGNRALAREFLERSLTLRPAEIDGRGRVQSLRALATVYGEQGDRSHAIKLEQEALALAASPAARGRISIQLAVHTDGEGRQREALAILDGLLEPQNPVDPLIHGEALVQRATIERASGAYDRALPDLDAAIPAIHRLRNPIDEFAAQLERARVLRALGRRHEALAAVDRALEFSQSIRSQTANPELRAQLQTPLRPAYDLKLDLLWDEFAEAARGHQAVRVDALALNAFRTADGARARSFGDVAATEYSPATLRKLAPELAQRARLYSQLAARRFALDSRLDGSGSADPRAQALESELAGLAREVDTVNNAIAAASATSAASSRDSTAGMAAASVPADAAILAYWIGAEAAYAWALTPAGIHWVRLDAPAVVTNAARAFHRALSHLVDVSVERRLASGAELFSRLIRPIEPWVVPYRRWFVVPDGVLDYVPFAALRTDSYPSAYFVAASHDVARAPAAWVLFGHRMTPPDRTPAARVLLVSDPVYEPGDPRLGESHLSGSAPLEGAENPGLSTPNLVFRRLPGTAREAAAVAAEFSPDDVASLSGFGAARATVLSRDWSRYRVIHIAAHGVVDSRMPQLSALILSAYGRDGRRIDAAFRAADLSLLTLDADVAVFSGCETALGKEVLSEGMAGLGYAALARGAGAVVASLWAVPDETAAQFMTEFYRHLVRQSMSPTAALGATMRSRLVDRPAADPALWAPFQVSVISLAGRDSRAISIHSNATNDDHQ
jgi:CHAT domain-containing protein/tetratricopeptide (TPR) repeat protein